MDFFLGVQLHFTIDLGINTPHPGALYNDALTVERVWQSLLMYAILLVISIFVYVKGLKRRIQDA